MPKLVKRATRRKRTRTARKRYKRTVQRRRRVRRTKRKLSWYRKFKGKRSMYSFSNSQGLKYSLWLSIPEMITFNLDSFIAPVLAAAGDYDADHPASFKSQAINSNYADEARALMGMLCAVFSTEDMTNQINQSIATKDMLWKAWNPILSAHSCGPLFNNMINQYNKVKFCGVKVSWHPNIKYVNTRTVDTFEQTNRGTAGNNYNSIEIYQGNGSQPLYLDLQGKYGYDVESPKGIARFDNMSAQWRNDHYGGYNNPPCLKFWVNFNKQGYEQRDILSEKFCDASDDRVEDYSITASRFSTARVFDNYNHPTFQKNIKCYNFNKPFKFYVRPMLVRQMQEAPTNNAPIRNYEPSVSGYQLNLNDQYPKSDVLITGLKPMPYVQINNLYPIYQDFIVGPQSNSVKAVNDWVAVNTIGRNFFDPILFSWCLTDDSLPSGMISCPFSVVDRSDYVPSDALTGKYLACYDYLRNLGKFKVTFYTKWKDRNQFQYIIPIKHAYQNANVNEEVPSNDMDEENDSEPADLPEGDQ
nr:putative capsid protein [Dromedary stool-associated circular ssDNA virus]